MCTVTIIPKENNDFVLTSNRDEAPNRISLAPDFYTIENTTLLFPKDELSGGTWIGVSEKNRLVCVLNGGFELHKRKSSYRFSRGIVAKDFLVSDAIETIMEAYNLIDIEPFTMVIVDWNSSLKFYDLVWDGTEKHIRELPLEPKIWSSSTLYSQAMKLERKQWFDSFKDTYDLNANSLMEFHKTAGKNNDDYGVIMDRGFVKTMSITQVDKTAEAIQMHYENLQKKEMTTTVFNLPQPVND
jgi:Transport and Golgi organisation 2